jgi:glycosyltransferase involved in cell wall biosynthesis
VRAVPDAEHHLLYARRADAPIDAALLAIFSSADEMVRGHLGRVKQLRQLAQSAAFDVLHLHSSFAGAYGRLAAFKSERLRIVYTPHCFAFERQDVGRLHKLNYIVVEALLGLNTSMIAACSEREQALGTRIVGKSKSVLVPNAVDDVFVRLQSEIPFADSHVLRVAAGGRLSAQRDPNFFVRVRKVLNDADVLFTWIGGGDPSGEAELRRNGIRVTGWLDEEGVVRALKESDIYFHTAAWDGFPMSVLEATALGVPSVVRRTTAFAGMEIKGLVETPSEAAASLRSLRRSASRLRLLRNWRSALKKYNPNEQEAALRRVYGVSDVIR